MKKLKVLRGALIGVFVVAAACCIFTACSSDKDSADNTPITDMTLSVDNVKRTYLTYQSFSSDGIEATVKHESGNSEAIVANDLVVDYSAFNNSIAGEYDIIVSYTENGVTLSDSYTVEVIEEITGLAIEKDVVDYTVESASGVNIDVSDVRVYAVDGGGQSSTALSGGSYELKFFKNGDELSSLNGVSAGIYTIYAYRNVSISGKYSTIDYECGAYVLVYVTDTLQSITLNEGAVVSQALGMDDLMTGTWTFTLMYESGMTKQLTTNDVEISGVNTKQASGENGSTATVTYSEYIVSSSGRDEARVSVDVTYTIEAAEGAVAMEYEYSYSDLLSIANVTGDVALDATWFSSSNVNNFLTYIGTDGAKNRIRTTTSSGIIEIYQEAFQVTFSGTGVISIECSSNGSNDYSWSNIGLKNENKYYMRANVALVEDELVEHEMEDDSGYTYEMLKTTHRTIEYTITEPGMYTIETAIMDYSDGISSGQNVPDRPVRIYGISMTDIAGGSTEEYNTTIQLSVDLYSEDLWKKSCLG